METGKMNRLKVIKTVEFGVYLDGGEGREILLPARYVPDGCREGDETEVFIYHDNEGRLIATTLRPLATVGEFQWMQVKDVCAAGAFLEWGLMKDLLVPLREQKTPMKPGRRYLVYVYLDLVTKRIVASARIDRFLDNVPPRYERNQEVDLIVAESTDLGYKVIINHQHWGLVYHNETFHELEKGEKRKGYIKEVREDDRIDVSLYPLGYEKVDGIARRVLQTLRQNGGFLSLHDRSDAGEIYSLLACSKKSFKKALGALYRQQLIMLEKEGIRLVDREQAAGPEDASGR
ncbi:MAG: GntR family transcriptional regulator [Tannerella sp.]|jgi:predicted RNA-binding protein (virulence factor B family)|nr:GntR family transcriptional regulator [Tannerella sp.]